MGSRGNGSPQRRLAGGLVTRDADRAGGWWVARGNRRPVTVGRAGCLRVGLGRRAHPLGVYPGGRRDRCYESGAGRDGHCTRLPAFADRDSHGGVGPRRAVRRPLRPRARDAGQACARGPLLGAFRAPGSQAGGVRPGPSDGVECQPRRGCPPRGPLLHDPDAHVSWPSATRTTGRADPVRRRGPDHGSHGRFRCRRLDRSSARLAALPERNRGSSAGRRRGGIESIAEGLPDHCNSHRFGW